MIYEAEKGDFTLALGGDFMLTQRISVYQEANYLAVVDALRGADVAFVNLETDRAAVGRGHAHDHHGHAHDHAAGPAR